MNDIQFASKKEIEEFYDMYSESMYVDPAESTPDMEDATEPAR